MKITIEHEGKTFKSYTPRGKSNCKGCAFFLGKTVYFGCYLGGLDVCGTHDLKFKEVKNEERKHDEND